MRPGPGILRPGAIQEGDLPTFGRQALKRLGPRIGFVFDWGAIGRELYYEQRDGDDCSVFVIPMDPSSGTATGPPTRLFQRRGVADWEPAPDGQRFLLSVRDRSAATNDDWLGDVVSTTLPAPPHPGHGQIGRRQPEIEEVDCENVLRGGVVRPGEYEHGSWRYRIETSRLAVVVAFRSENELVIVTAWRTGR